MKKRGKQFAGMGVLLIVFALGFTGCDWIKSILGMEEDDPKETPETPGTPGTPKEPETPEAYLTLYVSGNVVPSGEALVADASGGEEAPDGTEKNPFGTVGAALARVAAAYAADEDEGGDWKAKVKEWKDAVAAWKPDESESESPPNPGKAISAEIVIVGTITSEPISIPAAGDIAYPPLILRADKPVNTGDGDITLSSNGSLLTVSAGANLTLRNITLKGKDANTDALVTVNGGHLTLEAGAVITGNTNPDSRDVPINGFGGGVYVSGGDSAFTMNGGTISGNTARNGSGVYVSGSDSAFTMNGGTISGNTATNGGGVVITSTNGKSSFEMNGGTISRNTATWGGGVNVAGSGNTFTMNGGTISRNEAEWGGGVYVIDSATFTMNDGAISYNTVTATTSGGGVCITSKNSDGTSSFEMNGGTISGNKAGYGGGVNVTDFNNAFTMNGGTISDNTADLRGGGVAVQVGGTFTLAEGTISGNTAGWGGGVLLSGSAGGGVYGHPVFEMTGGTISGNKNTSDSDGGGGVAVGYGAIFTMSGGTIGGNTSTAVKEGKSVDGFGGGVSLSSGSADGAVEFTKTGNSTIYGTDVPDDLKNTAKQGGSAVYVHQSSAMLQKREKTVGPGVDLYWPLQGNGENWVDPE
jgi:hypothetical protein